MFLRFFRFLCLSRSLLLLGLLPLLALRIYRGRRASGTSRPEARLYAAACALGKLAEFQGVATYAWNHLILRRATALLEYKGGDAGARAALDPSDGRTHGELPASGLDAEQRGPRDTQVDA